MQGRALEGDGAEGFDGIDVELGVSLVLRCSWSSQFHLCNLHLDNKSGIMMQRLLCCASNSCCSCFVFFKLNAWTAGYPYHI